MLGEGQLLPSSFDRRTKKGRVDPTLPADPFNDPDWEDTSHPEQKKMGHHKFRNKKTGESIEFHKGKEGEFGHKAHDHYHRPDQKTLKTNDSMKKEIQCPKKRKDPICIVLNKCGGNKRG